MMLRGQGPLKFNKQTYNLLILNDLTAFLLLLWVCECASTNASNTGFLYEP